MAEGLECEGRRKPTACRATIKGIYWFSHASSKLTVLMWGTTLMSTLKPSPMALRVPVAQPSVWRGGVMSARLVMSLVRRQHQ